MATKVIVLVSDRDDAKHGEITVLDDPRKAERLVETLLEAGFDEERIRIFNGAEIDMQVTHRPVVALVGDEPDGSASEEESAAEEENEEGQASAEVDSKEQQEAAVPLVQNGVRFSSLFRSA